MKRSDHQLVQQVLDGEVTREVFDDFQQRLREEPKLVALYENYALLHHSLSEEFEGGHGGVSAALDSGRRGLRFPLWLMVGIVVAILAAVWGVYPWKDAAVAEDAAVVTFSVDAVWWIEGPSRSVGAATGIAKESILHLRQGRANIAFEPAVTALVEGPLEMRILGEKALHMEKGRGYFHRGGTGGGLTVSTPRLTAVDSGTEFGIVVPPDGPDELFVTAGEVRITSKSQNQSMLMLSGDAARVSSTGPIERFPANGRTFAQGLGRFRPVLTGPFEKADWRVTHGNPEVLETRIEGMNFAMFRRLSAAVPGPASMALLVTVDLGKPSRGQFHTAGWAGMSLFSEGREMVFFGDSYGSGSTWSLDVKQQVPVIQPEHPVTGPQRVTLRYDPRSGEVSLHEGGLPLKVAFCSGKIPAGSTFDELRLGASSGASLAVKSIDIRVGED